MWAERKFEKARKWFQRTVKVDADFGMYQNLIRYEHKDERWEEKKIKETKKKEQTQYIQYATIPYR
jgi:hypothetical protein